MKLPSRRSIALLTVITTFIVCVHIGTVVLAYGFGHDNAFGLWHLFDLDGERNVPAVFSVGILLGSSILLLIIAVQQKPGVKPRAYLWVLLSVIFLFLAADEGFEIHERISRWRATGTSMPKQLTDYLWLFPYAMGVLAFGAAFLRFLMQLPPRLRRRFIIAGTIYVAGAMGMEELGELYVRHTGTEKTIIYRLEVIIEETMEMVGVVYFLDVLLAYIHEVQGGFHSAVRRAFLQKESAPSPEQRSTVPPR
jgi:hypothetical protein